MVNFLTDLRHRGHQTREHGGAYGGHYLRRVSPSTLQRLHVFELKV
jgi:hypothetical protein